MKISLSWLADFIDLDLSIPKLDEVLTSTGLSVEGIESAGVNIPHVVIAQILESQPHPDADRLSVCQVADGSGIPRQIVCGAKNYQVGDKIPLALPGAVLPGDFRIKPGKLRGVKSEGMMCSGAELGLCEKSDGLLILPADAPVGHLISELYPPETVIDLEITPNRPDWLSHLGVGRELSAFLKQPLHFTAPVEVPSKIDPQCAKIENGASCPFYSVRSIRDVSVCASPDWLRRRLESIGLRAINNVVDITNYVLHELGQPLHAFDAEKVQGAIVVRLAHEGETFAALDGKTYILTAEDTVIADSAGVLALAGIMGGAASGVTENTKHVLLESALFTPSAIRRTARRTGLQSDSSYRFERGVDAAMVPVASARACSLIAEFAGGILDTHVVYSGEIPEPAAPVSIRAERCRALLGADLTEEEIASALTRVGLSLVREEGRVSWWQVPSFRLDLLREVDLIEEVARIVGIDRIPSRLVATVVARSQADIAYDFQNSLREKLTNHGFSEARLSTLVSQSQLWDKEASAIRLKNPLGEDQAYLRPSLLPGLLQAARRNFHAGIRDVRLFELGAVYSSVGIEQQGSIGILATGSLQNSDWRGKITSEFGFYELRGLVETLFPLTLEIRPVTIPSLIVAAELFLGKDSVGHMGILAPALARELDASSEVVVAEIHWTLVAHALNSRTVGAAPIPKFPSTTRDIALILSEEISYHSIYEVLTAAKEDLLVRFKPFDLFRDAEGHRLAVGKKSLAISLTFQSMEKTLSSHEIDAATDRLKSLLREKLTAEFRE